MGYALGLGYLPRPLLEGVLEAVLSSLTATTNDSLPVHTEGRRDAIKSITRWVWQYRGVVRVVYKIIE